MVQTQVLSAKCCMCIYCLRVFTAIVAWQYSENNSSYVEHTSSARPSAVIHPISIIIMCTYGCIPPWLHHPQIPHPTDKNRCGWYVNSNITMSQAMNNRCIIQVRLWITFSYALDCHRLWIFQCNWCCYGNKHHNSNKQCHWHKEDAIGSN